MRRLALLLALAPLAISEGDGAVITINPGIQPKFYDPPTGGIIFAPVSPYGIPWYVYVPMLKKARARGDAL